jgi:hypothetical protein
LDIAVIIDGSAALDVAYFAAVTTKNLAPTVTIAAETIPQNMESDILDWSR